MADRLSGLAAAPGVGAALVAATFAGLQAARPADRRPAFAAYDRVYALCHSEAPRPSPRKLRLYACGVARLAAGLLGPEHLAALARAEALADSAAPPPYVSNEEMDALRLVESTGFHDSPNGRRLRILHTEARTCLSADAEGAARYLAVPCSYDCGRGEFGPWHASPAEAKLTLADCVFGGAAWPGVPPGSRAPELAKQIYAERAWQLVPVLADLLEEEGADPAAVAHLRLGTHCRGCWVVDALLGRG
jgi:hypothetical protein